MRALLLILAACLAVVSCSSAPAEHHGAPGRQRAKERSYAYGSAPNQRLVAYRDPTPVGRHGRPAASGRRPVVVLLHGGFWFRPQPAPPNPWAERIAATGAVVFDVDYRRNLDAPWPAQRSDVLRSLRWIARHAGIFGVDPHRVVLLGSSAGGQIATSVGTYGAGRALVAGVVALSPPADPYLAWRTGTAQGRGARGQKAVAVRNNAALLAGCVPRPGAQPQRAGCRRVWRDMDAVHHASGADDAPMLLIHSRRDFVPARNSYLLRRAELRAGMPAREISVDVEPGGAHGGELMGVPGVAPRVLKWIEARTRG
jgi:acetyl esterase